ncbi:hypothetical protein [Pseudaminobacter soli (ex Li et al. 2025)]|uniref:Uncharacterized protein n=1 Tax=Pseudaminobacter soli (ex Li et al. 2025) TaxID=1295366 RepID=A0A2P7SEA9_9HYPH|nr:hypothetical protein [Mesorhizobium soli]PSJ60807.1 hypothetical protein C7I85_12255 [Mesorhizobium soli]
MPKLCEYEIEVLRMMDGGPELPWGAAMSAALEFLADRGLCTRGPNYRITPAGRAALQAEGRE